MGKQLNLLLECYPVKSMLYYSFLYEDVSVLFCDEISMVGSSKFTRMNFQLQDITGSNDFMGGLSFVAVGDFRQLPPVRDQFIYEKNHLDGRPTISPSHWDDNFKIYYLSDKMRNQKDPVFASLCDRVGNGTYTNNDLLYLQGCVKETESESENENFKTGKVSLIVLTNNVRQEINEHKLNTLLTGRKSFTSIAIDRCTNLENPPEIPHKLSITQTGGLETRIVLKRDAPIVITSNHPKAKYKEDGIVNGAKGYVDSIQVSKTDSETIDAVWVVFKDKKVGKLLRYDYKNLSKIHKSFDENAVPILRQKKTFSIQNGEVKFQRNQFPLTLAYAITAYKCQGDTLDEVIIDFAHKPGEIKSVPCGSFYVALTRVKEGKDVYLKSFNESYITVNKRVEEKIETMRKFKPYTFKKIYVSEQIFEDRTDELKLGYFNINGFMSSNHAEYIDSDINLLYLDFLVISETWLNPTISNAEVINRLENWKVLKRLDATDNRKHMGLLLLTPKARKNPYQFLYSLDYIEGYSSNNGNLLYQGLVMDIKSFYRRAAFLYIRETPSSVETNELTKSLTACDWIIGDLNLNPKIPEQKKKLLKICGKTKFMALQETTTVNGSQLEHVIIEKEMEKFSFATSFFNFASDHRSIVFRVCSSANSFTTAFKQKITFNSDLHMKTSQPRKKISARDKIDSSNQKECQENINTGHFKILMFINPADRNLCFSNSIVSALLNIKKFNKLLSKKTDQMELYSRKNEIIAELINLNQTLNLSNASTQRIRSVLSSMCEKSGQIQRNFSDNSQHDAGEFLISLFEHLFSDPILSNNIDEEIFGGLYQEKIVCKCGKLTELPVQKLSEILMTPLQGQSIQSCFTEFLSDESINHDCKECGNQKAVKTIEIITEPSTLIIQLKRYTYDVNVRKIIKRQDEITCPKSLVMPSGSSFTLSSIVNHIGISPTKGHYNVLLYDQIKDCFVLLDDLDISFAVNIDSEMSKLCYIVVYTKNA